MAVAYDLTIFSDGDPLAAADERHNVIMQRTLSLLSLWRQQADTTSTLTRRYHRRKNVITIHSASPTHVRIVITNENGTTHYDFSEMDDVVSGVYTSLRGKHTLLTDYSDLHDILARTLLECKNYDPLSL